MWTKKELEMIRIEANQAACKRHEKSIDYQEQMILVQFYTLKIKDYCKFFKFSVKVQHTAIILFKRFYIIQTTMDHDPKLILIACLFLSTKIEHEPIELSAFLEKVPKSPPKHQMIGLELTLSKHIGFNYFVEHPFWPLHGFFLDIQTQFDIQELYQSYQNAISNCSDLYLTDAPLFYTGSQIALACLYHNINEKSKLDIYLQDRFPEHIDEIRNTISEIIEMISTSMAVNMVEAKRIAMICQTCLENQPPTEETCGSDCDDVPIFG
jgi:cyclin H